MKAWLLHEPGDPWDNLRLEDVDPPAPGPQSVRVRVDACDLNFADILQCQGSYQVRLPTPFVPGMNVAGTVLEAGEGADVEVGRRLIGSSIGGHGGFAEQTIMKPSVSSLIPDDVSAVTAVGMHVTYGTSWFALHRRGNLQPGETVLVLAAAGGVGSSAVQLAKAHGCWVIAAAGGAEKLETCRQLGADVVVDYTNDDLYERVMEATSGRGCDVVYDPVGGDYFDIARRLVAWEGRLLVVGFASGRIPSAPANHVLVKNYSVVGVHMGGYRQFDDKPFEQCYRELYDLLLAGKIEPLVSE
ncbi:MAG: NADPH:quinone oxidoreductase family protein, partial [Actinomycetota bacterium]|nr:NADPH:quinone oxidoreductase family protein [Actinomycetota bacterium]